MDAETFSDPRVREAIEKDFIPVKIDIDKDQATPDKYGINGIPNILVLDDAGQVDEQVIGFVPPGDFLAFLRKSLKE